MCCYTRLAQESLLSSVKGIVIPSIVFHLQRTEKLSLLEGLYFKMIQSFTFSSADNNVILWSSTGEGKLKYAHNDSIQCMEFNPVTHQLLSCSCSDFGLWSQDEKEVRKTKVGSKILSCSWTSDGQHMAIGFFDGNVRIYNREGKELLSFARTEPIWTLSFNPSRDEQYDILAVGCWDQTLSFYHLSGKQIIKDQKLGFDPCSIGYFSNGEYLCVAGTSGEVSLWNKEGVHLQTITKHQGWVWSVVQRPNQNCIVSRLLLNAYHMT